MIAEEIRRAQRTQPFRPFTLRVADGRAYEVKHPELMIVTPRGRTVIVVTPDSEVNILDTLMITAIRLRDEGRGTDGSAG
jgi:hypothetical protein